MKSHHNVPYPKNPKDQSESYLRLILNLAGLALVLAGIAVYRFVPVRRYWEQAHVRAAAARSPAPAVAGVPENSIEESPRPALLPVPAARVKTIDRVAIATAQAALAASKRDRLRSEDRLRDAGSALENASLESARQALASKTLGGRLRDHRGRLVRASARGQQIRLELDRIKTDVETLGRAPKAKAKALLTQNPVAKPTQADEFHFELRRGKVAFIDLDRLLELARNDMRDKFRLNSSDASITAQVGPVGSFSLKYVLERNAFDTVDELLVTRRVPYHLQGWEIVPTFDIRGEDYRAAKSEISDYALAIRKLAASKSTITMWVYPDSFTLYRKLRDDLHQLGFTVAARPLPAGIPIRASASGSLSAGQ